MMTSLVDLEEEQFFDTSEEIESVSDLGLDHSDDFSYEFWTRTLESVHDRRYRFSQQTGLSLNQNRIRKEEARVEILCKEIKNNIVRINLDSGAVLRNSSSDDSFFSRRSSVSCSSTEEDYAFENNFVNNSRELEFGKNGIVSKLREVGSNKLVSIERFQKSRKNIVNSLFKKLRIKGSTKYTKEEASSKDGSRLSRTHVRTRKKRLKELSSLYEGQDFQAHKGLILAFKFSPDGKFLASAGEDGVVRVWEVIEEERENNLDIQSVDPSCLYFSVNHCSKLVPCVFVKDENCKVKSLKKSTKPGCVIFPPKVFRIAEEPLHEFHGHSGDVLALSWSSNECLLSSSVDKTVRLWQVGHDECLRVFSHNNYVTCVEFNPVDNNYFISGSIDGKIRIWEVSSCQVVDWIDIVDIVTAVCYYPSGKRAIVGSINGSCRFYDIIDNQLQLDTQIFLTGKKKSPCKRITGFQFCPNDSGKVLVTSADSQVRVLSGTDVVSKLKGPRTSSCQVSATFTEDGKHIVTGSEDSNIHVWDHSSHNTSHSKAKSIGTRESFVSQNSSIAIPWYGIKTKSTSSSLMENDLVDSILANVPCDNNKSCAVPSSPSVCFSLGRGIFMESWPKGPYTWPEEKLVDAYLSLSMGRSDFKVLKGACESMHSSHMWGLVIVTAGRDGRIRTYHNYGLPVHL